MRREEDAKTSVQGFHHTSSWPMAPPRLTLCDSDVHVWRVSLNQSEARIHSLLPLLAPDELSRAERFHFRKDRQNFITSRGMLRIILGRYLSVEPRLLRFCYSTYGKPSLSPDLNGEGLRFNLAHAHELALYAITRGREIGIDLEYVRDRPMDEVAHHFFSTPEISMLRVVPEDLRTKAFYNCWTRKEAYIKARGEGLSFPLDRFVVSLIPGEEASLLDVSNSPKEILRWSLRELNLEEDYVAAIAVEGNDWDLKCWKAAN